MPTRRDQLQAYQFMMQRVVSAVVVHETDPEQTPLRRGVGAVFAGVMIAVLVAAGFGIYGLFTGVGGTKWQADGAIVIERETGATFVYHDGRLRPVLNYASARLIGSGLGAGSLAGSAGTAAPSGGLTMGAAGTDTFRVSGKSLAGIPRETPVGIPGAPDSLPPPDRVTGAPWTLCSQRTESETGSSTTQVVLHIGASPGHGEALGEHGVLARDAETGTMYLIWRNHRYQIVGEDPHRVIRSLFGYQTTIIDVGAAWLNAIPVGEDIGPIEIEGRGEQSTALSGYRIGDVLYHKVGGGRQYYVVLDRGLAVLTELQVQIVRGQYPVEPWEISASVANSVPTSEDLSPSNNEVAPPPSAPELAGITASEATTMCAMVNDAVDTPEVTIHDGAGVPDDGALTPSTSASGTKLADLIRVPPGRVSLARAMPSGDATTGALYLVTDAGMRFAVPSDDVLNMLGYAPSDAVSMPASLVQRIPEGPTLDPAAALQPAPVTGEVTQAER